MDEACIAFFCLILLQSLFNTNRMCINDQCDPGLASSLVRRYIPNAVLKGRDGDELCYMLPLENTKSFPGNKSLPLHRGCKGMPDQNVEGAQVLG